MVRRYLKITGVLRLYPYPQASSSGYHSEKPSNLTECWQSVEWVHSQGGRIPGV